MSSNVTKYSQALLRPLEELHNSYTQFAKQHRDISGRLRSYANDLLSGTASRFEGMGAKAFEILVNYYLDMVEKQMQIFDDAASAVINCHTLISMATGVADAAGLNDALVDYILGQVTHNDIIQQGSGPIWGVVNDMQRTVGNMGSTGGDLFGNLVHFHFGNAFDDLIQEGSDAKQMAGDMMNLLQDTGRVLGQWATSVSDAVGKCLTTIGKHLPDIGAVWSGIASSIEAPGYLPAIIEDIKKASKNPKELRTFFELLSEGKYFENPKAFLKLLGDGTDLTKGGPFGVVFSLISVGIDVLDRKDNTSEKFFADLNGNLMSDLPYVTIASTIAGTVSAVMQIEGLGQQHLIAPWLAGGNSTLEKELGEPGAALNKDAQGISLSQMFNDLGDAAYNLNFFGEKRDAPLVQPLLNDIQQNHPQNLPQDLLHAAPGVILNDIVCNPVTNPGATGAMITDPTSNPGAALHDLKKAGKDLAGSVVSLGASEVDLTATESEDVVVASGAPPSWIAPMHQAWQIEHQPIESFRNWLARLPT